VDQLDPAVDIGVGPTWFRETSKLSFCYFIVLLMSRITVRNSPLFEKVRLRRWLVYMYEGHLPYRGAGSLLRQLLRTLLNSLRTADG
jgi:hypothetical protein